MLTLKMRWSDFRTDIIPNEYCISDVVSRIDAEKIVMEYVATH